MAHPLAGKPAPKEMLIDVSALRRRYYEERPDAKDPQQRVAFGTSGHRGSSLRRSFNEAHLMAIAQATAEYRASKGIDGPLYLGKDTHALSDPAQRTTIEVLAGNGVHVLVAKGDAATPTPVISHAILTYNRGRREHLADGIVITPSHNPPEDGGIKYNPPDGGPADNAVTSAIENRANELLANDLAGVRSVDVAPPGTVAEHDFVTHYVNDLKDVIDMDVIRGSKLRLGADPLGGSNAAYWKPIAAAYRLDITVVNEVIDPTFGFMPLDHDGKIRMDCSSPFAMANLVGLKDRYDLAFGNDTDSDRHGIVTRAGLMNPNHYLAVAIDYLFRNRPGWRKDSAIGKTLVSSALIDRVAGRLGRTLREVPVGFKYFVGGLLDGSLGFGGEESAGASFLRKDGTVWTTDKDGILLDLLAAEITARTGKDPQQHYQVLASELGRPLYTRIDAPATPAEKAALKKLSPTAVRAETLAGEPILARLTKAPGNGEAIGGLKISTKNGWFAARPSGTEDVYKIYAESFVDAAHLAAIVAEAKQIVGAAFQSV